MLESNTETTHNRPLLRIITEVHSRRLRVNSLRKPGNSEEVSALDEDPELLYADDFHPLFRECVAYLRGLETDVFAVPVPECRGEDIVAVI